MGLQRSTPGILGTIRDHGGERRARAGATVARLDRGRHLALYPAREHSHPANVFRAQWQTISFVRLQPDHPTDREQCLDYRGNHRRTRKHAHNRTFRTRARPLRTQCDAEAKGERIFMIADRGLRIAERKEKNARVADATMSVEDFRKRTFEFGIRVVRLVQALAKTDAGRVIGNQLLRSGTAVGANYRAAARARSRAEFMAKMGIVEEECDESLYWLEMLKEVGLMNANRLEKLRDEGSEILSMVGASIRTARGNAKGSFHSR